MQPFGWCAIGGRTPHDPFRTATVTALTAYDICLVFREYGVVIHNVVKP